MNFDPTYENGCHVDFLSFRKSGILGLVDHFVVCIKIFLEVIGSYKNAKQEIFLDSKFLQDSITGLGLISEADKFFQYNAQPLKPTSTNLFWVKKFNFHMIMKVRFSHIRLSLTVSEVQQVL